MIRVQIHKDAPQGPIKPMNGVNNFPSMADNFNDLVANLKLPYARLHDTAQLNPHLVDVHAVFPDFEADECDENAYDFSFTDFFIGRLHDLGIEAYYRLGTSIENYQNIKAYHIYPPKDFAKWARICEHIILHYNRGWANGFHYGLRYWEIWNEPENYPEIEKNQMWKGTFEAFLHLYEVAARHLKSRFPELKIGGYGSCGFYAICDDEVAGQANASARKEYFVACAEKFLQYAKEKHLPLDFFSWHSYSDVKKNVAYARFARELLDRYGFAATESHLNEWNPGIARRGTLRDASEILSNMLAMQDSPVDLLTYYDLRLNTAYGGLFDPLHPAVPFRAYSAFAAFAALAAVGRQVKTEAEGEGVFAVSAFDGARGACVIANNAAAAREFAVTGIAAPEFYLISEEKALEKVDASLTFTLKPFESILLKFQ